MSSPLIVRTLTTKAGTLIAISGSLGTGSIASTSPELHWEIHVFFDRLYAFDRALCDTDPGCRPIVANAQGWRPALLGGQVMAERQDYLEGQMALDNRGPRSLA